MAFCDQCGVVLPPASSSCSACGAELGYSSPPVQAGAIAAVADLDRETKIRYAAIGVAAVCGLAILVTGVQAGRGTSSSAQGNFALALVLLLAPLLGATVVAARFDAAVNWLDQFDDWVGAKRESGRGSTGWFRRFVVAPTLWCFAGTGHLATRVEDPRLRTGVKVSVYVYLLQAFLLALYVITAVVISMVLIALALLVISFFLEDGDSRPASSSPVRSAFRPEADDEHLRRGAAAKGATFFSGSNWFNEKKTGRVDEEGRIYSGSNWFNEKKTGRTDQEGNIYRGSNWFNEKKAGRVDEDGNIHEGTNWFNEKKVGRVDEDGNVYEGTNWFNEKKVGRVEKKEE